MSVISINDIKHYKEMEEKIQFCGKDGNATATGKDTVKNEIYMQETERMKRYDPAFLLAMERFFRRNMEIVSALPFPAYVHLVYYGVNYAIDGEEPGFDTGQGATEIVWRALRKAIDMARGK